jgi:hypothetical protein
MWHRARYHQPSATSIRAERPGPRGTAMWVTPAQITQRGVESAKYLTVIAVVQL